MRRRELDDVVLWNMDIFVVDCQSTFTFGYEDIQHRGDENFAVGEEAKFGGCYAIAIYGLSADVEQIYCVY